MCLCHNIFKYNIFQDKHLWVFRHDIGILIPYKMSITLSGQIQLYGGHDTAYQDTWLNGPGHSLLYVAAILWYFNTHIEMWYLRNIQHTYTLSYINYAMYQGNIVLHIWKSLLIHWNDININKANLRDFIATTGLVNLLKLDSNGRFFSPCDLEIWWMTPKNNRACLL